MARGVEVSITLQQTSGFSASSDTDIILPHTLLPFKQAGGGTPTAATLEQISKLAVEQGWTSNIDNKTIGVLNILSNFLDRNVLNGTRAIWVNNVDFECNTSPCVGFQCPVNQYKVEVNGQCSCKEDPRPPCNCNDVGCPCPENWTCVDGTCMPDTVTCNGGCDSNPGCCPPGYTCRDDFCYGCDMPCPPGTVFYSDGQGGCGCRKIGCNDCTSAGCECPAGQECVNGGCVESCNCHPPLRCVDGECIHDDPCEAFNPPCGEGMVMDSECNCVDICMDMLNFRYDPNSGICEPYPPQETGTQSIQFVPTQSQKTMFNKITNPHDEVVII